MTISDSRRLLLRHGAGERPRSTLARGSGSDSAYTHRHLLDNSRSVLKLGQDFGTMVASEAANGKSRMNDTKKKVSYTGALAHKHNSSSILVHWA